MKRLFNLQLIAAGMMVLATFGPAGLQAASRTLSLPSYLANPGGILEVPLMLDNAAGLAAIQAQINFDPEVLELLTVTAGPLGEAFELSQGDDEGSVQLTFVRAEALAGGAGRLAVLKFRANPGAVTDLLSNLAIADLSLSDSTGVIDLQQMDTLTTLNGQVTVTLQQNIDNARSGLPDWWEMQHELDLFTANAALDPEHDGISNLLEYAFGGNPVVADAHLRRVQSARVEANGKTYLSIGFHRRLGDSSLYFQVQESPDLQTWSDLSLPQQLIGTPQNLGDGTEFVNVLGTIPATGANAEPHGFMRVVVEKPD
jgi:Cohesin domain